MNWWYKAATVIVLAQFSQWSFSVDESRLWLPKKYNELAPKLRITAQEAENTSRCSRVITGRMIVNKSTEGAPYFAIICRSATGWNYNLGYSYPDGAEAPILIYEQKTRQTIEAEAEIARIKEKIRAKIEAAKRTDNPEVETLEEIPVDAETAWTSCSDELNKRVKNMIDIVIYKDPQPESRLVNKVERELDIPFDAKNIQGKALHYIAHCKVLKDGRSIMTIRARRD